MTDKMIEKQLRSRSIRFKYSDGSLHPIGNKYYYNFTKDFCSTSILKILSPIGINNVFEYTINNDDNILGYNFHFTEYGRDYMLKHLSHNFTSLYDVLSNNLGASFSNYSGGIKIKGEIKCGYKFYFYPIYYTNEGKMKVTGINKGIRCHLLFQKLNSIIQLSQCFEDEYNEFSRLCAEFRGVSFCIDEEDFCYNPKIRRYFFNGLILPPFETCLSVFCHTSV